MILIILLASTGNNTILSKFLVMYISGDLGSEGMFLAKFGPTLIKNELKPFAIFSLLFVILLFIWKREHEGVFFLAATKQLYEWFSPSVRLSVRLSVCLSVRPSVCHTFLTMFPSSYHHEIFRSYYQWQKWRPCKRSRSEVKGQGHRGHDPNFRFRTVTPVWIHIWWWNDTYSLMLLRRGALLFFKVIRQISRSHGAKIAEFDPDWAFPDCNSSLNSPMATKWCTKLEVA